MMNLSCIETFIEDTYKTRRDNIIPRESRKENGIVYTPISFANYIAQKTISYYLDANSKNLSPKKLNNLRIVDPACGDGILLLATWRALIKHLHDCKTAINLNPNKILCGIDTDQNAIKRSKEIIKSLSTQNSSQRPNLINTDALCPFNTQSYEQGWKTIKTLFGVKDGFDILIANPPWGINTNHYRDKFTKEEFALLKGQFDASDLFVELALSIVKKEGYLAFILPDSLFSLQRKNLRNILCHQTEIKFIGRFGEKIFEGINRACAVIICKKTRPSSFHEVDCLRLLYPLRKNILLRKNNFTNVEKKILHRTPQNRFQNNPEYRFDIDAKKNDHKILKIIDETGNNFRNLLSNWRGVEISKKGEACQCPYCKLWLPLPNTYNARCSHCKIYFNAQSIAKEKIIHGKEKGNYCPIIVGENIKRYSLSLNRWIQPNKTGINYKNFKIYEGPKILVRKTGVGISATIDYENSLTNQVVYIFKLLYSKDNFITLEFLLSILNSRAIYYYLSKNHGEIEWRSHPYLTQKQILDLPLPKINNDEKTVNIVEKITDLLRHYLKRNLPIPKLIDATIEHYIAQLYCLSRKDYKYIYNTINNAGNLLAIQTLNNISIDEIFNSNA